MSTNATQQWAVLVFADVAGSWEEAMTRYALLLRGVNVGTKNSLPMAELRAMLTDIGCTE